MHKVKSLETAGKGKLHKCGKYTRETRGRAVEAGMSCLIFARQKYIHKTELETLWQNFKRASGKVSEGGWSEGSVSWAERRPLRTPGRAAAPTSPAWGSLASRACQVPPARPALRPPLNGPLRAVRVEGRALRSLNPAELETTSSVLTI